LGRFECTSAAVDSFTKSTMADTDKKEGCVSSDSPIPSRSRNNFRKTPDPLVFRLINSFKRDPDARVTPRSAISGDVYDVEGAAQATADSPLARKLKCRHLQMIAIGGSIGMCDDSVGSC
jgi:hypothetical protein